MSGPAQVGGPDSPAAGVAVDGPPDGGPKRSSTRSGPRRTRRAPGRCRRAASHRAVGPPASTNRMRPARAATRGRAATPRPRPQGRRAPPAADPPVGRGPPTTRLARLPPLRVRPPAPPAPAERRRAPRCRALPPRSPLSSDGRRPPGWDGPPDPAPAPRFALRPPRPAATPAPGPAPGQARGGKQRGCVHVGVQHAEHGVEIADRREVVRQPARGEAVQLQEDGDEFLVDGAQIMGMQQEVFLAEDGADLIGLGLTDAADAFADDGVAGAAPVGRRRATA